MKFFKRWFSKPESTSGPLFVKEDADPLEDYTKDDLFHAALDLLSPLEPSNSFARTMTDVEEMQRRHDAKKQKFENYGPPRLQNELQPWLEYEQGKIDEVRKAATLKIKIREIQAIVEKQE